MPPRKRGGANKATGKVIRYEDGSYFNTKTKKGGTKSKPRDRRK